MQHLPGISESKEILPPLPPRRTLRGIAAAEAGVGEAGRRESFEIMGILGEGGMGVVYRAQQANPKRQVALKLIRTERIGPRAIQRFDREVEILGSLRHPGIAQLYSVGTITGEAGGQTPYMAMELVEGLPLSHCAARLELREKVQLAIRICEAVAYAHSQGVLHRDLKPANILVENDQPKILDFGVATIVSSPALTLVTEAGHIVGTFEYMSPEQAGGGCRCTAATDVYALGVSFYELFSGTRLFDFAGLTTAEALTLKQRYEPPPLTKFGRSFKGDLTTIIAKAMARDIGQRYATVSELAADLERFVGHEPVRARPPTWSYRSSKFLRRNRFWVGSITAVVTALCVGMFLAIMSAHDARNWANRADLALAESQVAQADALLSANRYLEARPLYDQAWSIFESHGVSTLPAELGVWELDQHCDRPLRVIDPTGHNLHCMCFSHDGKLLALGWFDGHVEVQESATGKPLWRKDVGHDVVLVAFSPDDRELAEAEPNGFRIRLAASGEDLRHEVTGALPALIAATRQEFYFATNDPLLVRIPDDPRAAMTTFPETAPLVALEAGSDDTVWAVDGKGNLLKMAPGAAASHLAGKIQEDAHLGAAIIGDGQAIVVETADGLTMRSAADLRPLGSFPGQYRLIRSSGPGVAYYDAVSKQVVQVNDHGETLAAFPAAQGAWAGFSDTMAVICDGQNPAYLSSNAGRAGMRFGPDGVTGVSALSGDGRSAVTSTPDALVVWDTHTSKIRARMQNDVPLRTLCLDDRGQMILALRTNGELMLGNVENSPHGLTLLAAGVMEADLAGDGRTIVSCWRTKPGATIWSRIADRWTGRDLAQQIEPAAVRIDRAGDRVALGGPEETQLWRVDSPAPRLEHSFSIGFVSEHSAGFTNGGKTFVIGDDAHIWSLDEQGRAIPQPSSTPVKAVATSRSSVIATLNSDESLSLFEGLPLRLVRRIAPLGRGTVLGLDGNGKTLLLCGPSKSPFVCDLAIPAELRQKAMP